MRKARKTIGPFPALPTLPQPRRLRFVCKNPVQGAPNRCPFRLILYWNRIAPSGSSQDWKTLGAVLADAASQESQSASRRLPEDQCLQCSPTAAKTGAAGPHAAHESKGRVPLLPRQPPKWMKYRVEVFPSKVFITTKVRPPASRADCTVLEISHPNDQKSSPKVSKGALKRESATKARENEPIKSFFVLASMTPPLVRNLLDPSPGIVPAPTVLTPYCGHMVARFRRKPATGSPASTKSGRASASTFPSA